MRDWGEWATEMQRGLRTQEARSRIHTNMRDFWLIHQITDTHRSHTGWHCMHCPFREGEGDPSGYIPHTEVGRHYHHHHGMVGSWTEKNTLTIWQNIILVTDRQTHSNTHTNFAEPSHYIHNNILICNLAWYKQNMHNKCLKITKWQKCTCLRIISKHEIIMQWLCKC